MTQNLNGCDYGHETVKETRRLPIGGDSAVIVCYQHYLKEISFRQERNKELDKSCQFDLPKWEDLEKQNKYKYLKVIQGWFSGAYGWEDCAEYDTKNPEEMKTIKHDIKEYRLSGQGSYKIIKRRVLNS